jgi:hypothetical protein
MNEYYSKTPVVKAIIFGEATVKELTTEFWDRGYFVKVVEPQMRVMEMCDNTATSILMGQYVVFHTEDEHSVAFDVMGPDEFAAKYCLHIPKEIYIPKETSE